MEIGYLEFGECPICLETTPGTREHVPPQSIGGNVMTRTCEPCNSKFGSLYEPHLQTWYNGSTGHIRISSGDVLGRRHGGEYLVRETVDGKPVLFSTGYVDPSFQQMLLKGKFEITYPLFDDVAFRLAAIKTAYLAACLFLKMVPRTDNADALRAELVAARDHPGDGVFALSPFLESIRVRRTAANPVPGEIAFVQMLHADDSITYAISFNRVFSVDWPLDPILLVPPGQPDNLSETSK
ncbi:HNH endonuclease [Cryobacterium algoricola]|nr:HNH endonuclease [Cryobacterium algoricola]